MFTFIYLTKTSFNSYMMVHRLKYNFLMLAAVTATIMTVDHHQNKFDSEEREIISITSYRYRRSVFKSAGEAIGRKIAQLSRTADELAHLRRASTVLKADAKFLWKEQIYEKHGGIHRAETDFLQMNVQNVEMQAVNKICMMKWGIIGAGSVRFVNCKGKSPAIVYNKFSSMRWSSDIQVRYIN